MKNHKKVAYGCFQAFFCLLFIWNDVSAQTQTARYVSMVANSKAFYEYLPEGYNSESASYPLLVFIHGVGELGDGSPSSLTTVLRNGPPKLISQGTFPVSFTVNGQVFKFIVISPQFVNWPSAADVQGVIDYAVRTYRVNSNRIYLTGLSMGGGVVWDYGSGGSIYANRLAALVPVCGASASTPEKAQTIATANLPVWATHNQDDPTVPVSNTNGYIDAINSASPRPTVLARKTIFPVSGHDAWTTTYSLTFKENNLNVYEWMLQYQRGSTQPVNQAPVAKAGNDASINLPTSSVTLAGSGTDADGNIAGYSWSKISGPTQYSINNSNVANPTISNLAAGDYTFRLTVTDNGGATGYDDINIKVVSSSTASAIPGKIESENYSSMSGVLKETTTDAGAGSDVGYVDAGDWMDYNVSVSTAGNYSVNFRLASPYSAQQLQVRNSAGTVLATINVPLTSDWQKWSTVTALVSLPAGSQTLRIYSINGGCNINWMDFLYINPAPVGGAPIPGKIEAENYDAMSGIATENTADAGGGKNIGWVNTGDWMDYNVTVATAGSYNVNFRVAAYAGQQLQLRNSSGTILATVNVPNTGDYQTWTTTSATVNLPAGNQTLRLYSSVGSWNINWLQFVSGNPAPSGKAIPGKIEAENYDAMYGIGTENTADAGGGKNIGWMNTGDWLDYNVTVGSAGNYTVNFRVAAYAGQQLQLRNSSGTVLTTLNVPNTGDYQAWQTATAIVTLPAGNQTLRLYSSIGAWNINWLEFVATTQTSTGKPVPGRIEAESYDAMNGIGTENTSDVGGGKSVGWIGTGDWLDYKVYVASAGTYTVNFRLASALVGQQLQLRNASGSVLTTVNVPLTGSYSTWGNTSATVTLPAGEQTLRLYSSNGSWNINWMDFASGGTATNANVLSPGLSSSEMAADNSLPGKKEFTIYPNPVKNNFSLQLNNGYMGTINITVADQSGKIVKTFKFEKNQPVSQLNLLVNELTPGMYFLKVQIGNWSDSKKLIKL